MRVLVDEGMPVQVREPLTRIATVEAASHRYPAGSDCTGVRGMARVIASVVAAMPYVLDDLGTAKGQRVVQLSLLKATRRHDVFDPRADAARFPYWH